jgi:hypothetical protein
VRRHQLVLKDDELDNVVLPKEDFNNLKEGARWMAVVKVHMAKHFGNQFFSRRWSLHGDKGIDNGAR